MAKDKDVHFQLNLFQRWQLLCGHTEVQVASRQQRLIAALALFGPRNRRYMSGLLWPDSPEARALESLRVSIHLISRQTPGLLVNGGAVLSLVGSLGVDLHQCLEQVRNCECSGSRAEEDVCLSHVRSADLLPGWYEDWVILEQNRLRNFRLRVLVGHARRWLEQEEAEKAADAARTALELEPLQESCVGLLMRAELMQGNRVRAMDTFENFKARLTAELGVSPSPHLTQLAAGIRGSLTR
ncbi:AfsR/SARP family transcriptional regulator [Arthrobacter globiformis]|uniref:AfsR/SARP family transcriptional regulator n=1 Tax=Arthrobacter globiformis TaxID=1665 RepID=UPI00155559B2|nr:BTAD domain-containing putative transcriptional regulator [Arthrobacter globiformis]